MEEDDVNALLELAKCEIGCLTPGQIDYVRTFLLSAWLDYQTS